MDIVDEVVYRFEDSQDPEHVRRAYCDLFSADSLEARVVVKHLVRLCKWEDEMDCNDPIINAKYESLRGIIRNIKKQLNQKPIELGETLVEEQI
jgi:hypothetical protein